MMNLIIKSDSTHKRSHDVTDYLELTLQIKGDMMKLIIKRGSTNKRSYYVTDDQDLTV